MPTRIDLPRYMEGDELQNEREAEILHQSDRGFDLASSPDVHTLLFEENRQPRFAAGPYTQASPYPARRDPYARPNPYFRPDPYARRR